MYYQLPVRVSYGTGSVEKNDTKPNKKVERAGRDFSYQFPDTTQYVLLWTGSGPRVQSYANCPSYVGRAGALLVLVCRPNASISGDGRELACFSVKAKVKDLLDAMRSIPYVGRHDYYDDDFAKKRRNHKKSVSTN